MFFIIFPLHSLYTATSADHDLRQSWTNQKEEARRIVIVVFKPLLPGFHGHLVLSICPSYYIFVCLSEKKLTESWVWLCVCVCMLLQKNWSKGEELKRSTSLSCVLSLSNSWLRHIRRLLQLRWVGSLYYSLRGDCYNFLIG